MEAHKLAPIPRVVWLLVLTAVALILTHGELRANWVRGRFVKAAGTSHATAAAPALISSQLPRSTAWKQKDAVSASATTGRMFEGNKVRDFLGPKLFSDKQQQQQQQQQQTAAPMPRTPSEPWSVKWAVCTTVFQPSQQILDMLRVQGWHVVVVGDRGAAPFNVTAPNLVYLNVDAQDSIGAQHSALYSALPWKHFGRKNLGYLYAIMHGAQRIWDFDDDNGLKPSVPEPSVPSSEVYQVLVQPGCDAFNPYPLMGAPKQGGVDAWPRGLPLQRIRKPCLTTLVPGNMSRVAVVQSLADHEPDVDGIFRLTRDIPFNFDPSSKRSLVVPRGVLSPYNAQATLVLYPALFTQLLPVTVHGRVSDIWRSYIAQRLLWDVGYHVAFAPPMVTQLRNPHNFLADMQSEEPLYYQAGALVKQLHEWQGTATTIAGRFEELVIHLYERGYIEQLDVELTQQWLRALQAVGYSFPQLQDWSPPPVVRKKAAVCVAGQLRSVKANIRQTTKNFFDVAEDYDMFVYVQSRGTALEPQPGNTTACDAFKRPEHPDANVFCEVVAEEPANVTAYIPADLQKTYFYAGNAKLLNGLIQQLLGLKGCWEMAKKHSFTNGIQYDHLVRMRPDNWFYDPIPPLSEFNDTDTLYIGSRAFRCCGNEDIFHISSWKVAEAIMNRLDSINSHPMASDLREIKRWIAEDVVKLACKQNKFKLVDHPKLHVHVERRPGQRTGTSDP